MEVGEVPTHRTGQNRGIVYKKPPWGGFLLCIKGFLTFLSTRDLLLTNTVDLV